MNTLVRVLVLCCFVSVNRGVKKGGVMGTLKSVVVTGSILAISITSTAFATDDATSLREAFTKGKASGNLKSFYYAETFDTDTKEDSNIWANGGNLEFVTGKLYGLRLGGEFQVSFIGYKDDDSNVTKGSMDAEGAVMSEAYLQYDLSKTRFKGGRQHINLPLIANSGSRLIKESFEGYFLTNTDIPDTTVSVGWVRKYQTRTDESSYADNFFVDFEENGSGKPGDFYDVGDDGLLSVYLKNSSLKNLAVQAQYTDVFDAVAGLYADAKYTFAEVATKPYVAGQYFYTSYDDSAKDDNYMVGMRAGLNVVGIDFFGGFTTVGGSAGDARVYRGLGQGAYNHYTDTTKTAGVGAFEAGTDSYQAAVAYKYEKAFTSKLRFTRFDNPIDNADLDEYTLNLAYNFSGILENWSFAVDFTVLDYENNIKDATDLRTRLVYTF